MRFSINQRFLRDLRQVAAKTFGRSTPSRPRSVHLSTQLIDGRHRTRAVIQEAGVTLMYTGTEEQEDASCFDIDLKALRPFESSRDSGVLIRGDLDSGTATICADVPSRISQQSGVAIAAAEPSAVSEPVASAEFAHSILDELAQATSIADPNSGREALRCLSLDGSRQTLAATDGRKALITDRLDWPWDDERLVARNGWFSATSVRKATSSVVVSDCEDTVRVTAGPWSLELPCETHRFPDVQRVVPRSEDTATTLTLTDEDHAALLTTVKVLPHASDRPKAVTLDLYDQPTLRVGSERGESQAVLPSAFRDGPPQRVALSRDVLTDVAKLELGELRFVDPHKPLWGTNAHRTYVAMPLHPDFVVTGESKDTIKSTTGQPAASVS